MGGEEVRCGGRTGETMNITRSHMLWKSNQELRPLVRDHLTQGKQSLVLTTLDVKKTNSSFSPFGKDVLCAGVMAMCGLCALAREREATTGKTDIIHETNNTCTEENTSLIHDHSEKSRDAPT